MKILSVGAFALAWFALARAYLPTEKVKYEPLYFANESLSGFDAVNNVEEAAKVKLHSFAPTMIVSAKDLRRRPGLFPRLEAILRATYSDEQDFIFSNEFLEANTEKTYEAMYSSAHFDIIAARYILATYDTDNGTFPVEKVNELSGFDMGSVLIAFHHLENEKLASSVLNLILKSSLDKAIVAHRAIGTRLPLPQFLVPLAEYIYKKIGRELIAPTSIPTLVEKLNLAGESGCDLSDHFQNMYRKYRCPVNDFVEILKKLKPYDGDVKSLKDEIAAKEKSMEKNPDETKKADGDKKSGEDKKADGDVLPDFKDCQTVLSRAGCLSAFRAIEISRYAESDAIRALIAEEAFITIPNVQFNMNIYSEEIIGALGRVENLKHLSRFPINISLRTDTPEAEDAKLLDMIADIGNVHIIDFEMKWFSEDNLKALGRILEGSKDTIVSVSLTITDESVFDVILPYVNRLKRVAIRTSLFESKGFAKFLEIIQEKSALKHVGIYSNDDKSTDAMINKLAELPTVVEDIKSIEIGAPYVAEPLIQRVPDFIRNFVDVENLSIALVGDDAKSIKNPIESNIIDALNDMPYLKKVHIDSRIELEPAAAAEYELLVKKLKEQHKE
jgi:hypothetical protein